MYWFNRGYRCHPMPNQLEAMKMGETARIRQSAILWILLIAFAWGTLCAYWANLHVTFSEGATAKAVGFKQWVGDESYGKLGGWLQTPAKPNFNQTFYVAAGFLMVLISARDAWNVPVVALPPGGLRARRFVRDGLFLVLFFRGVVRKIPDYSLRRHEVA